MKTFNTKEINDLPASLKKQVEKKFLLRGFAATTKKLISLFDQKKRLTISEIIVGLYRKYKIERNRLWVRKTLSNLAKRKIVRRIDNQRGIWEKQK